MASKEIKEKKERLVKIQRDDYQGDQMDDLRKLALEVGASRYKMYHLSGGAGQAELVDHIHQALQTASMIEMCKTASRNFIIALIATIIALGSAVALWVAVCK